MSINKVMISGNITWGPELRQTPSGTSVLSFGVAVNDNRRNQQTGEWEEYANFVQCTAFGNKATSLNRYLTKGQKVAIEGKLHYSSWEKDGQKRSKLDVTVDQLEFMSSRNDDSQGGGNGGYGNNSYNNQSNGYGQSNDYGQVNSGAGYGAQTDAPAIDATSSAYEDIPF